MYVKFRGGGKGEGGEKDRGPWIFLPFIVWNGVDWNKYFAEIKCFSCGTLLQIICSKFCFWYSYQDFDKPFVQTLNCEKTAFKRL